MNESLRNNTKDFHAVAVFKGQVVARSYSLAFVFYSRSEEKLTKDLLKLLVPRSIEELVMDWKFFAEIQIAWS